MTATIADIVDELADLRESHHLVKQGLDQLLDALRVMNEKLDRIDEAITEPRGASELEQTLRALLALSRENNNLLIAMARQLGAVSCSAGNSSGSGGGFREDGGGGRH